MYWIKSLEDYSKSGQRKQTQQNRNKKLNTACKKVTSSFLRPVRNVQAWSHSVGGRIHSNKLAATPESQDQNQLSQNSKPQGQRGREIYNNEP